MVCRARGIVTCESQSYLHSTDGCVIRNAVPFAFEDRDLQFRWISIPTLLVTAVFLVSCSEVRTNHGYVPSEAALEQIEPGTTTSDEVLVTIGNPLVVDELYNETWLYVDTSFMQKGMHEAEIEDQNVVAITFTGDGRVARVDRLTVAQTRDIALNADTTEIHEGRLNLFNQLMRAFGRVDPQTITRQGTPGRPPS